jgi:hypothetical protein
MTWLSVLEFFELPSLMKYPRTKLGVVFVARWDKAIAMLCLVLAQFFTTLAPYTSMRVPTKANALKSLGSFFRHVRPFACLHEYKVTTLLLDP